MTEKCDLCNADGLVRCKKPSVPLIQGRLEIRGEGGITLNFEKIADCTTRTELLAKRRGDMQE